MHLFESDPNFLFLFSVTAQHSLTRESTTKKISVLISGYLDSTDGDV